MTRDYPPKADFKHLMSGRRYRVIQAFVDFDGAQHPVGEVWTFVGSSFLPYDDGLSLFIVTDGNSRQIRLQWRQGEQEEIIDHLQRYVQLVHDQASPELEPPLTCPAR